MHFQSAIIFLLGFSPQQFSRKQILPCCAEMRNVFLHFGQNKGKFCKMVSSRICVLVFPRHSGHKIHICAVSAAIFPPNLSLIPALRFLLTEFLLNLSFLCGNCFSFPHAAFLLNPFPVFYFKPFLHFPIEAAF